MAAIAGLTLVTGFDLVEQCAKIGAPKYMEWYLALGIILTLVWLYIEILNLLSKAKKSGETGEPV